MIVRPVLTTLSAAFSQRCLSTTPVAQIYISRDRLPPTGKPSQTEVKATLTDSVLAAMSSIKSHLQKRFNLSSRELVISPESRRVTFDPKKYHSIVIKDAKEK
jgi:hypothetical protein